MMLLVGPQVVVRREVNLCFGQTYLFNGQVLSASGAYFDTLISTTGNCDTLVELQLSVVANFQTQVNARICQGAVYLFGGQFLDSSGFFTDTLQATNGCDSIINLQLQVLTLPTDTFYAQICSGQSYVFGNQFLGTSGIYTRTLSGSVGCDTLVVLVLTVFPPLQTQVFDTICQSQTYQFGSLTLSSSGIYTRNLLAFNGCDSVIQLRLTVLNLAQTSVVASICQGQVYSFGSQSISAGGVYQNYLNSANGCDSIVTLTLIVLPVSAITLRDTICQGQSYLFGSSLLTQSGVYNRILLSSNGCDSLVQLVLTVSQLLTSTINAGICQGQSYMFGNQILVNPGTYSQVFQSGTGCDSLVVLHLAGLPSRSSAITASICQGQSYAFGSQALTAAGTYTRTLVGANGCDSVVTLTLVVNSGSATSVTASICQGRSYAFGSQTLTTAGTYTRTLVAANGCDSVVTLVLSVTNTVVVAVRDTLCQGQTYVFGSQILSTAGVYPRTLVGVNGCDSTVVLTLTVNPNSGSILLDTICQGGSLVFGGDTLGVPGVYYDTLASANGCDSVVQLLLLVLPNPQVQIMAMGPTVLCSGDSVVLLAQGSTAHRTWQWYRNGVVLAGSNDSVLTVTTTGTYYVVVQNLQGCVSTSSTLFIQVNPTPTPVATLSGGVLSLSGGPYTSYQWYRNNTPLTGATQATYLPDSNGTYTCLVRLGPCSGLSNNVVVTGVGVFEMGFGQVYLYPNPSSGWLFVSDLELGGVRVTNSSGQKLEVPWGNDFLDLTSLPAGMYSVELIDAKGLWRAHRSVVKIP